MLKQLLAASIKIFEVPNCIQVKGVDVKKMLIQSQFSSNLGHKGFYLPPKKPY